MNKCGYPVTYMETMNGKIKIEEVLRCVRPAISFACEQHREEVLGEFKSRISEYLDIEMTISGYLT